MVTEIRSGLEDTVGNSGVCPTHTSDADEKAKEPENNESARAPYAL